MASFLTEFTMLQDVSVQHRSAWARGYARVLRCWRSAVTEEDRDRALMWLGFLPQCLQRKPIRGGRSGRAQVAYRYTCLINEDWGSLVELWEKDQERRHDGRRGRNHLRGSEERDVCEQRERLREVVLSKGLRRHSDQASLVCMYPQLDKLSTAWL